MIVSVVGCRGRARVTGSWNCISYSRSPAVAIIGQTEYADLHHYKLASYYDDHVLTLRS
jgi:hypothetical protein